MSHVEAFASSSWLQEKTGSTSETWREEGDSVKE